MSNRKKRRGVAYIRRSGSKQETSLETQLSWAIGEAGKHDVALDVSLANLDHMRANRLHKYGDIYLDDAISGADLERPGFCALIKDIPARKEISNVFVYKRDRLGRPNELLPMMVLEQGMTNEGITIVFNDGMAQPTRRGQTDLTHIVQMLFGYHQSGDFLRQLAERVIDAQRHLAQRGFRTGGNAPYGFGRFLVDPTGKVVEELVAGRYVRQPGHHVVIRVNNPEKIAIWVYLLDLKHQGWGCKRIAKLLNDLGIPSPDAGKERTDQGVRHAVSGMWSPNSITSLCRNKAIIGMQDYGRRSEGAHRRLGDAGPRVLEDSDNTLEGKPRVIFNEPSVRISAPLRDGQASFDVQKWHEIKAQMDERGQNQRGVRRAKDPAKYPLGCMVFDLTDGCGSVMYGTAVGNRAVYRCGRYMRTAGSQCRQNSTDGEALLQFVLQLLVQKVKALGAGNELRQKLEERARAEYGNVTAPQKSRYDLLRKQIAELKAQLQTAERRMVTESDDGRYEVIARHCEAIRSELIGAEKRLTDNEQLQSIRRAPEVEVASAIRLFDEISRIATDNKARAEIPGLLDRLGLRVGLTFGSRVRGEKRIVQQLLGGVVAFGDTPLPVPTHGNDNRDDGNLPVAQAATRA